MAEESTKQMKSMFNNSFRTEFGNAVNEDLDSDHDIDTDKFKNYPKLKLIFGPTLILLENLIQISQRDQHLLLHCYNLLKFFLQ